MCRIRSVVWDKYKAPVQMAWSARLEQKPSKVSERWPSKRDRKERMVRDLEKHNTQSLVYYKL